MYENSVFPSTFIRALNCILTIPLGEEIILTSLPGGCFLLKCVRSIYHKRTRLRFLPPHLFLIKIVTACKHVHLF